MTRLELLRRHALANVRTARRLDRLYPSDSALLVALDSESTLAAALMSAGRLDADGLSGLIGEVTNEEAPGATEGDVMTVRMVAKHG
jgi:hypothetical protein